MIVVDSSAFLKLLLKEDGWEEVIPYLEPEMEPHAPDLLAVEVTNAIWKYAIKFKLITRRQAVRLQEHVERLIEEGVIALEPSVRYLSEALSIALNHLIPVYDSLFLAQTKRLEAKLVTSDRKQKKIAENMGLKVIYLS